MPTKSRRKAKKNKLFYETHKRTTQEQLKEITPDRKTRKKLAYFKKYHNNDEFGAKERLRAAQLKRQNYADNQMFRNKQRERSSTYIKQKYAQNQQFKNKLKERVNRRLQSSKEYRDKNRERARINTPIRLQNKPEYKQLNRMRAANRKKAAKHLQSATRSHHARPLSTVDRKRKQYWMRRSRYITDMQNRTARSDAIQVMCRRSSSHRLDVILQFSKAAKVIERAVVHIKCKHRRLVALANEYLQQIPTDAIGSEAVAERMFGTRSHCSTSEPYYWQSAYQLATHLVIPIDNEGKARVFDLLPTGINQDENNRRPSVFWHCRYGVCSISEDHVSETQQLLKLVVQARTVGKTYAYTSIVKLCTNSARSHCLGHSITCDASNCEGGVMRLPTALSTHFPSLRTVIRRVYEIRNIECAMKEVRLAQSSKPLTQLIDAIAVLEKLLPPIQARPEKVTDKRQQSVEEAVMTEFGKALRRATDMRDTYSSTCCALCEQLKDVRPMADYEGRKGFSSEKMTRVMEMLFEEKTDTLNVDEFLSRTVVCKYCIDKLLNNREPATSIFNSMRSEKTPDCIASLNVFERSLIKFVMPCMTLVRLGPIRNTRRPRNEMTSALVGRIAYFPLDTGANATFLPEQLLNIDSLVLMVGGQPTKNKVIWLSSVDLNKVHLALQWLHENNDLYRDVPYYSVEDLKAIITNKVQKDQRSCSPDGALLKKIDEAAKSTLFEHYTVQPLNQDVPEDTLADYLMERAKGPSLNVFDSDLDRKAFPELLPSGRFGLRDTCRSQQVTASMYIKSRLLNKDPKYRTNMPYLFAMYQLHDLSNASHSIGHMLRTVSGNSHSARALLQRLQNKDGEMQKSMFSMMSKVRGTVQYFAKLGMDVQWMVRELGPPTLFVTVSCAEWYDAVFIQYLRDVNSSVRGIDTMTPAELCAMDPVNVSIHLHNKWHAIFSQLIASKDTPIFGVVEDYFWRVEYQARGAPHVHCMLWIEGAPILGRDNTEEVIQYLEKIATCDMPDSNTSPTLHELVKTFQVHKCNKYCTKLYRTHGKTYRKCRFGFPRPTKDCTEINDVVDCLAESKRGRPRKRIYHLRRSDDATMINDYNPALLLASQSNVDVQYIGHRGSRLVYYITCYMTKHERSEQDDLWKDAFTTDGPLASLAWSLVLKSLKKRQVGACEAADNLLGHKLYSKSRQMKFADLGRPETVKRIMKPVSALEDLAANDPNTNDVFQPHTVIDIYPDRPDALEECSLHEFVGWYDRIPLKVPLKKEQLKLKSLPYILRKRTNKPYIVMHQKVNQHLSPENRELYYYYLLKLFKPWRTEGDLQLPGMTSEQTFEALCTELPAMQEYHEKTTASEHVDRQLEESIRERAAEKDQREETGCDEVAAHEEGALVGCAPDHLLDAMQDIVEAQRKVGISTDELQAMYDGLNVDQRRVIDTVVRSICDDKKQIRLIVSGQGGTGKSRVITVLSQLVHKQVASNLPAVVVCAPTGLAAFNIGGSTVHRTLALPIEHGKPADYRRLNQEQLNVMRSTLKNVKLVIIDEVSMLSSLTVMYVHLRLTELMNDDSLFGGVSVVCFADLLQLPPVKGNQPFIPVSFLEAKQRLSSVATVDLWNTFAYDELTINMRQKGDKDYANLLADLRRGKCSDDQLAMLRTRLIANERRADVPETQERYKELRAQGQSPVILLPTIALCNEYNNAMLSMTGQQVYRLKAVDTRDTSVDEHLLKKVDAAYKKMADDVTRTAGLECMLEVSVGAQIMLKRNKDVEAGLVNGSVGTVVEIKTLHAARDATAADSVTTIEVKFDKIERTVSLSREAASFEVLHGIYYTRKQFPIMLAFAITIHKSQGLSLTSAIVDVGAKTFGPGMTYVALSRITSLQGLHLIDVDRNKLKCDMKAVAEYNRLREKFTPHLGPLAVAHERKEQSQASLGYMSRNCHSRPQTVDRRQAEVVKAVVENAEVATPPVHVVESPYHHTSVASLSVPFRTAICLIHDLLMCDEVTSATETSTLLRRTIQQKWNKQVSVKLLRARGDGNCLFRALSLAIAGNEENHQQIRHLVTQHMLEDDVRPSLELSRVGTAEEFDEHVRQMECEATWGTDEEISAAAHLFECSIMCLSRYGKQEVDLQYFSPHHVYQTPCENTCHHETLYLIHTGAHYDTAIVTEGDGQTGKNI